MQKCVVTISHHFLAISSSPEWFICVSLDLFAKGLEPGYWEKLSTVEISRVRFHLITLKFDSRSLYVFAAIGAKFNIHNPSNRRSNEICANSSGEHSSC